MRALVSSPMAALALTAAGCSAPVTGELMIAVQTDMAVPKDLDQIRIQVHSDGKPVMSDERFDLGPFKPDPGKHALPGTQGLTVSEDPGREIDIRVQGLLRGAVRVEHTVITTIPEDRVATLWAPLHFACLVDPPASSGAEDVCPEGSACAADQCKQRRVSSALLPEYVEEDFDPSTCFDVAACFDGASPATFHPETCSIEVSGDAAGVNVAIATEGDGVCGASGCFVPLDAGGEFGWRPGDDGILLPEAVCAWLRVPERRATVDVVTSPVKASCPRKRIQDPLCPAHEEAPIVLAARQRSPVSLAVGKDSVFWTEQGVLKDRSSFDAKGAVKRVALEGGAAETLAREQAVPRKLALDPANTQVFWTNRGIGAAGSALMRKALDSKEAASLLLDAQRLEPDVTGSLEGLATDGEHLFWTQVYSEGQDRRGGVGSASLDGRMATKRGSADYAHHIAAAADLVCWTEHGTGGEGAVWCQKNAGTPVRVGGDEATPQAIALDAKRSTHVFWVNFGGEIVKGAVDGAERRVLFEDGQGPHGVALDERWVYWTNRLDGTVKRLPRDAEPGGRAEQPAVIARGQHRPTAITVDADVIYWVNEGSPGQPDGAVVRLAKPPQPP